MQRAHPDPDGHVSYADDSGGASTPLRVAWFTSLMLTALAAGAVCSHAIEAPGAADLSAAVWLDAQQVLYRSAGFTFTLLELGALAATLALAVQLRRRPRPFGLAVLALICFVAMILVWVAGIHPLSVEIASWNPQTMPANWPEYRNRWEDLHAIRAGLVLIALGALILSTMADAAMTGAERPAAPGGARELSSRTWPVLLRWPRGSRPLPLRRSSPARAVPAPEPPEQRGASR